jgi:hypothetical protein
MSHVQPVADRIMVIEHGTIAHIIKRGDASVGELSDIVAKSGARHLPRNVAGGEPKE